MRSGKADFCENEMKNSSLFKTGQCSHCNGFRVDEEGLTRAIGGSAAGKARQERCKMVSYSFLWHVNDGWISEQWFVFPFTCWQARNEATFSFQRWVNSDIFAASTLYAPSMMFVLQWRIAFWEDHRSIHPALSSPCASVEKRRLNTVRRNRLVDGVEHCLSNPEEL